MIAMRPLVPCTRRSAIAHAAIMLVAGQSWAVGHSSASEPDRKWYEAAAAQRKLAESWGDQSYGAVLVLDGTVAGEGPSRVVKNQDADAHAEREAIRDAQRRLGRTDMAGSVLYSTSRPCALCEAAAARAGVSRMYFGPSLVDAGVPRPVAQ
ncbi:deaminase [Variovorax robiniae]|uniref:Deaminase n=1 Tax=Variovorax robiniae TaxID=1836199 RepID=A0ABU8X4S5_9BURK